MGHLTYLGMELIWALPVIALQWIIGHRTLRTHLRLVLTAVLLPTLYLSMADALAIRVGIWTLNPELTLDATNTSPQEAAVVLLNYLEAHGLLTK